MKKKFFFFFIIFLIGYTGALIFPPNDLINWLSNNSEEDKNFNQLDESNKIIANNTILEPNSNSNENSIKIEIVKDRIDKENSLNQSYDISLNDFEDLEQYSIDLINRDRMEWGVNHIKLGEDLSAQEHADDLAELCVLSHWDSGGMKPYMRYSLAEGEGAVSENAAIMFGSSPFNFRLSKIKETISKLEYEMMYNDAESNWGHRDNIIDPLHNKVSIGISWNEGCLVYIQHFEDDYIKWINYPNIQTDGRMILSGIVTYPISRIKSVHIAYDMIPEPMNKEDLENSPNHYSLGDWAGVILPPLPLGWFYKDLSDTDFIADKWRDNVVDNQIEFEIEADVLPIINQHGDGVYTISLIVEDIKGENLILTNISIFINII